MSMPLLKWASFFVGILMINNLFCEVQVEHTQDINFFRSIPKAELHLHLGGSYPLDFLLNLASPEQKVKLLENLKLVSQGISYQNIFHVFNMISQIVNTEEKIEEGTYETCRSLEEDGVVYAEIRTGLKNFGDGLESYLQAVLRGIKRVESDRFKGYLLLSLQRSSSLEFAKKTIDLALQYKDKGVVGIDLSGDSTIGNLDAILPEILRAKEGGLLLTVHIGETPLEKNQKDILEILQPHRIGHGVHLASDALDWVLKHRVPVEVCLTSSLLVEMINHYAGHPWLSYYLQGHPIVICTDDPLLFQTTLSKELQVLANLSLFSHEQIEQLVQSSFQHAFRDTLCHH